MDSHKNTLSVAGAAAVKPHFLSGRPLGSGLFLPLLIWMLAGPHAKAADAAKPSAPAAPIKVRVQREPLSNADLRQWYLKHMLGDYDHAGRKDPKWDAPAREALTLVANLSVGDDTNSVQTTEKLNGALQSALDAGCNDPVIRYFHLSFGKPAATLSTTEMADRMNRIALDVEGQDYSDLMKFYLNIRAVQKLDRAFTEARDTNLWNRASKLQSIAAKHLAKVLSDPETPCQEGLQSFSELLYSCEKRRVALDYGYPSLFKPVFEYWPTNASVRLMEGWFFTKWAWAARGTGWAYQVTEKGNQLFEERLEGAKAAYLKAWQLDPKDSDAPTRMIDVMLGLSDERNEMEIWFRRAMYADTNNYVACKKKLWYLDPRWYGSEEDLLKFGHECVESKKWGGQVPLILVDAHHAIQVYSYNTEPDRTEYWLRPEVWPDVKLGFERYFEMNPTNTGYRHNYALYAYRCRQWDELNRQLKLFAGRTNYNYFGGREAFEKMAKEAKDHQGKQK